MSYTSALQVGKSTVAHAALIIDGIPVLFGTRSGLTLDTTSVFLDGPLSLTSAASMIEAPSIDGQKYNADSGIVEPGGCKIVIRRHASWDKYFQPRRDPQTRLTGNITGTQLAGIPVISNDGFEAGGLCYIDRECMLIEELDGATLLNITSRMYAALTSNRAFASHTVGAYVSAVPRSMLGRSAELYVWSSETDSTLMRRLVLKHVQVDNARGAWELSFEDVMAMFDKKVASGFEAARVRTGLINNDSANPSVAIDTEDDNQFLPADSGFNGAVMLKQGGYAFIGDIASFSGATPRIALGEFGVASGPAGSSPYFNLFINEAPDDTVARRVYVLSGNPMTNLLRVFMSDRGDLDNNATYDVLFGQTSSGSGTGDVLEEYQTERRMGAAIPAAMLNLATTGDGLLNPRVLNEAVPGYSYVLGHNGEESLLELMRDAAWHHQGIFYVNGDGKLSFRRIAGTYATTNIDAVLNETNILRITSLVSVNDETEVVHTFGIDANFDPGVDKYLGRVNVRYPRTHELYKDSGKALDVKCKSFMIDTPQMSLPLYAYAYRVSPATLADLVARLNRQFYRRQGGLRKVKLDLPWRYHTLFPGTLVTITHSGLDAFNGTTLNGETFLVTAVDRIDFQQGVVSIQCEETWTGKPVSPTGKVSSWVGGGTQTITLATSDKYGGGTSPGDYFAVGWKVRILEQSATPPFSNPSGVLTVSGKTATTVTVTGVVGFTPTAGDILVQAQYDDADSAVVNVAEGVAQRGHAFLADTGLLLGSGNADSDFYG